MEDHTALQDLDLDAPQEQPLLDLCETRRPPGERPLSAPQLVERILAINPSASAGFLGRFRPEMLANYLDHLVAAELPRGQGCGWIRRGDSKAIMVRETRD